MANSIKNTLAIAVLALSGSAFSAYSYAVPVDINGSSTIGTTGANITGINLSAPGLITVLNPFYGTNIGDYSPVPVFSTFTLAGPLNLSEMSSFNITGPAGFGAYNVSELIVESQDASFLNVYTRGLFTPGAAIGTQAGGCATGGNTCAISDTSFRWSFTQSGNSVSASASLASPSIPLIAVPEPASLSLLMIGLIGGMASLRKSAKKTIG